MASEGVTTRMQKELNQLQEEVSQIDAKLEARFTEMHSSLKGELKTLLEKFMRSQVSVSSSSSSHDKVKGILSESPPGLQVREALLVTPRTEIDSSGNKLGLLVKKFQIKISSLNVQGSMVLTSEAAGPSWSSILKLNLCQI